MLFEESPKKKAIQESYSEPSLPIPSRQRLQHETSIRYSKEMMMSWGPPSAESAEVMDAFRKDRSIPVSLVYDPETKKVELRRKLTPPSTQES